MMMMMVMMMMMMMMIPRTDLPAREKGEKES